jgi:ribose transport system permease protein
VNTRRIALGGRKLRTAYPFLILGLAALGMTVAPRFSDGSITVFNVYNVFQIFADLGLLALALGLVMIAGEYDLSTAGAYVLGGILAVKLGEEHALIGIAAALIMGLLVGCVQGGIVAKLGLSAIPVTLGGYLLLIGTGHVVSGSRNLNYQNYAIGEVLDRPIASIFSVRSLATFGIFGLVWLVMSFTRIGPEMRAVGGDRRAGRVAGVPVGRTLILVLVVAGVFSALGGVLTSYSLASASPDVGLGPLIFATIAALLGGVSLAGGRGSALGIAAGVLSYAALQETLAVSGAPDHVANLVTGSLLLMVTAATAPELGRQLRTVRTRLASRGPGMASSGPLARVSSTPGDLKEDSR